MGNRKKILAESRKEIRKTKYFSILKNESSSPRKMRLVVNMIRGMEVFKALGVLKYSNKNAAGKVEKLLRSAISNWEQKTGCHVKNEELYITSVNVDSASMLKRMIPAPQGRRYRIRKRSNHVTLIVDTKNKIQKKTSLNGTKSKSDK